MRYSPRQSISIAAAILTIIIGTILLVIATFCIQNTSKHSDIWKQLYSSSIFSVIISIFLILVTIGYIYVVIRQFPALISVYSALIGVVAFVALICVIILIPARGDFQKDNQNKILTTIKQYSSATNSSSITLTIDYVQQTFECCGFIKAEDWALIYSDSTSTADSCCKNVVPGCGENSLNNRDRIFQFGCSAPMKTFAQRRFDLLILLNSLAILFGTVTAILGGFFQRHIRSQYQLM